MAEGITSRDVKRDRKLRENELNNLEKLSKKSGDLLGVNNVELLNFPDNRMDSIDLLDIIKVIENFTIKLKPNVVVTHHAGDLNIDHQITHQAVMTACRPQPKHIVKRILSFEVPSGTEWQSQSNNRQFVPNWYEEISENNLNKKIEALYVYKSEMREWPHARSVKAVKHLARWRGSNVGCDAAEAFMLLRNIC